MKEQQRCSQLHYSVSVLILCGMLLFLLTGCGAEESTGTDNDSVHTNDSASEESWTCAPQGGETEYLSRLGCFDDFNRLSSLPISAEIPGARSVKVVIDRLDGDSLYFQDSTKYKIHYDFASANLSGNGLPFVPTLSEFNLTEYYSMDRRFLLGAVTYYEEADVWAYEISPYDTASAEMVQTSFELIEQNTYFGNALYFHPTSEAVSAMSESLPSSVRVITTEELFEGITYQPLNLGTSYGQLRFYDVAQLEAGTSYISFRDIAVLDQVPNDISVASGIITGQFQTPLSHINVLSQNRGTPNMALKGVLSNTDFRAFEGKWVKLTVGPYNYEIEEVSREEADDWWEEHRPTAVQVPTLDTTVTGLVNIADALDPNDFNDPAIGLKAAVRKVIPAFGGKAAHYSVFPHMDNTLVPYPDGFIVPVSYYVAFMQENGFFSKIDTLLADEAFQNDPAVRDTQLGALRDEMKATPIDAELESMILDKLAAEFPGIPMRFRSSTNAEDLEGFTGAGLYTSKTGNPNDPSRPVADAIRTVWSSVWYFRAFEEREYRGISHKEVGMALLVHRSFPDEEANGVAVTANIFDTSGMMPGFYVNVQFGEESVVKPPPGITTDQFILQYDMPGQPVIYIAHSNLVASGNSVLTRSQILDLGAALNEIHSFFRPAYGTGGADQFYAMDVEFKFDGEPGEIPQLFIKQARPYPGWGSVE